VPNDLVNWKNISVVERSASSQQKGVLDQQGNPKPVID